MSNLSMNLSKIKKIKTILKKWLTNTQLINKEIFLTEETGFLKFYTNVKGIELGMYIDVSQCKDNKKIYIFSYESLNYILNSLVGESKTEIELIFNDNAINLKNENNNLFLAVKNVLYKKNKNVERESFSINNFLIDSSLDFIKNVMPKNDEINNFNYTNIKFDKNLIISVSNIISVANVEIEVNDYIKNSWVATIPNESIFILHKWIKSINSTSLNVEKTDDLLILKTKEGFINISIEKDEYLCNVNNSLIKFNDILGSELYRLDVKNIKLELSKFLTMCKANEIDITKEVIPFTLTVQGIEKRVNAYLFNKIINKFNDFEILFFNKEENTPLIIKDNISNSKIIFNVLYTNM